MSRPFIEKVVKITIDAQGPRQPGAPTQATGARLYKQGDLRTPENARRRQRRVDAEISAVGLMQGKNVDADPRRA